MNPQSAGRTPNQANTYREQYVASLMLDISNQAKTLNASRGIATTGSSGAPPVDGRTITEKYADIDALKVSLRSQLKEITDGQNAQDIVFELTTNELEFLAGQIPFVISDLKPKWKLGIPAEAFVPYLRKLMRKTIETQGVEYGLQEAGGGGGGLPPPTVNNLMPVEVFQQFMYDLDDILEMPEEGDLQSVGSFASSLAPSEASSQYSQMPIDFGAQFGNVGPPPPSVKRTILMMRNAINQDMTRIVNAWPSEQDAAIMDACPDPFIVENYQETVAAFADTLPNLEQMEMFRDDLAAAIGDGDQAQAEGIIREWSAVVSNVDVNVMEQAKEIVRQARLETLNLDADVQDLFPEPEQDPYYDAEDEQDELERYFQEIQAAPASVSSYIGSAQPQVPEVPEDMSVMTGDFTEEVPEGEELDELPPFIPVLSFQDFRDLETIQQRRYLTLIAEIIPNGALQELFLEVFNEGDDRVDAAFEVVYPIDENASGGNEEDLLTVYEAMLRSEVLKLQVGAAMIDEESEIASLPSSFISSISSILSVIIPGFDRPPAIIIPSEIQPNTQPEIQLTQPDVFTPISVLTGDRTPVRTYNPASAAKYEAKRASERGAPSAAARPLSAAEIRASRTDAERFPVFTGENPYKFATEADFEPGGKFNPSTSGNGIMGCGKCSGRGMSCCDRCSKKMKAGKLPIGKGKNIIIGRGIGTKVPVKPPFPSSFSKGGKVTSKVVPSNIDLSLGVKAEPSYVSFGKHLINKHRLLKDNVLMLRTMKGGAITSVPTQKISRGLSKVLKTIIGGGSPDYESLNTLTNDDKEVLYNISKTSRISNSVPNPNKSAQEQEDNRFELLKGQIASGQDNKDAVKEFKLLLIKMMNQKRIPKGQGIDILTEMAAMGL